MVHLKPSHLCEGQQSEWLKMEELTSVNAKWRSLKLTRKIKIFTSIEAKWSTPLKHRAAYFWGFLSSFVKGSALHQDLSLTGVRPLRISREDLDWWGWRAEGGIREESPPQVAFGIQKRETDRSLKPSEWWCCISLGRGQRSAGPGSGQTTNDVPELAERLTWNQKGCCQFVTGPFWFSELRPRPQGVAPGYVLSRPNSGGCCDGSSTMSQTSERCCEFVATEAAFDVSSD